MTWFGLQSLKLWPSQPASHSLTRVKSRDASASKNSLISTTLADLGKACYCQPSFYESNECTSQGLNQGCLIVIFAFYHAVTPLPDAKCWFTLLQGSKLTGWRDLVLMTIRKWWRFTGDLFVFEKYMKLSVSVCTMMPFSKKSSMFSYLFLLALASSISQVIRQNVKYCFLYRTLLSFLLLLCI